MSNLARPHADLYWLFGIKPPAHDGGARVSVIMPVYNGGKYLENAIRSVLAQDYLNYEAIIVDDGSTDSTVEIARKYQHYHQVRYIRKSNGGVASALNAGIRAMTGDFFCWLSHDDVFHPHKISRQIGAFYNLPAHDRRAVLFSDYDLIDAQGNLITSVSHRRLIEGRPSSIAILRGLLHGCSVLIPRMFFEEVGLFDEGRPYTQDYDLWGRALGSYRFVHMPEPLIQSRWHDEQGSKRADFSAEFNRLWLEVLDRIGPAERKQIDGNDYAFWANMADFLRQANALEAAAEAELRAERVLDETKVSVVIPFYRNLDDLRAAIASALEQSHPNIEVIVVYDTPDQDITPAIPEEAAGTRVFSYCQNRRGAGEARNFGIMKASGDYIAFLDSDDLFLPDKVRRQLAAMLKANASISHTSYKGVSLDGTLPTKLHPSGTFSGRVFPEIIVNCPIAMPTVMAKTDFLRKGHMFPEDARGCEDFLLWIRIARDNEILGIDEPLSIVHTSARSVAYDPAQQKASLETVVSILETDPDMSIHTEEISHLRNLIAMYADQLASA